MGYDCAVQILTFQSENMTEAYSIQGELQAYPVQMDKCQAEILRVNAAQVEVKNIEADIASRASDVQNASPAAKAGIIDTVRRMREEVLAPAIAALKEARREPSKPAASDPS